MVIHRRWFRFSIGMLLVLMTCIAGYFGGYKAGKAGFTSSRIYVESYDVARVVTPVGSASGKEDGFDTLIDLLKTTITYDRHRWDAEHLFIADRDNMRLVVAHNQSGHEEVASLLAQLNSLAKSYHDRVAKDLCGHCGKAPLPALGAKCEKCGTVH